MGRCIGCKCALWTVLNATCPVSIDVREGIFVLPIHSVPTAPLLNPSPLPPAHTGGGRQACTPPTGAHSALVVLASPGVYACRATPRVRERARALCMCASLSLSLAVCSVRCVFYTARAHTRPWLCAFHSRPPLCPSAPLPRLLHVSRTTAAPRINSLSLQDPRQRSHTHTTFLSRFMLGAHPFFIVVTASFCTRTHARTHLRCD